MLRELIPDQIWYAQQPLKFGPISLTTRMTVVKLSDGTLWVHSPILPTPELRNALAALGSVRFIVAPNKNHHLYFLPYIQAYPSAQAFIAPELGSKRPDLQHFTELDGEQRWQPDLQGYFIEGLPVLNETVWFHPSTGTLLLTDLLFCFGPDSAVFTSLVTTILGVRGRLAMSRTMKMMTKDKRALSRSVAPLLSLPVQRIVVAHDQIVEDSAASKLKQAFQWLD